MAWFRSLLGTTSAEVNWTVGWRSKETPSVTSCAEMIAVPATAEVSVAVACPL
jgi:hypothetical protein